MTPRARGALIALVQVAVVASVGGKLLYDRAVLPRAWIETAGVDPDLPIRGRYVALNLVPPVVDDGPSLPEHAQFAHGRLEVRDGRAVAVLRADAGPGRPDARHPLAFVRDDPVAGGRWRTLEPVAFFLPEDVPDPTLGRAPGELWVEATLPPRGAPRPLRLGVARDGRVEPLPR